MIRLRIKEVAEQKGLASASDLARRTGVAFATANRLWKNELGGETDRGIGYCRCTALHEHLEYTSATCILKMIGSPCVSQPPEERHGTQGVRVKR